MEKILEITLDEVSPSIVMFEVGLNRDREKIVRLWGNAIIAGANKGEPAIITLLEVLFAITETIKDLDPDLAAIIQKQKYDRRRKM